MDLWLSTGVFGIIDATIIRKPSSKTVDDKPNSFSVKVALLPRLLHPSFPTLIVTSLTSPSCGKKIHYICKYISLGGHIILVCP